MGGEFMFSPIESAICDLFIPLKTAIYSIDPVSQFLNLLFLFFDHFLIVHVARDNREHDAAER
jgi:hypothetical protein